MNNLKSIPFVLLSFVVSFNLFAQQLVIITDSDLQPNQSHVWTSDNTYLLDGFVYLEAGGVLEIEPGTVIRGRAQPSNSTQLFSALIIMQGASIQAKGDPCNPIIFTTENDDLQNPQETGQWGGLVLLGNAPATPQADGSLNLIRGISSEAQTAVYGGDNPDDNSGVLEYVSIRYAGEVMTDETFLPGLTLAGVGKGTSVSFVEVFATQEDGVAILGGTVNLKNMVSAFSGGDAFFWDKGYSGFGQFWFGLHSPLPAAAGGRHFGGLPNETISQSNPTIFNATFLGAGVNNAENIQANIGALGFSDGSAGRYSNSIIGDFSGFGLFVQDIQGDTTDSYGQLLAGNIEFRSNLWSSIGSLGSDGILDFSQLLQLDGMGDEPAGTSLISHLATNNNLLRLDIAGLLRGISRSANGQLDPRPVAIEEDPIKGTETTPADPFFTPTPYKGAFGPDLWLKGWTALDFYKYLPDCDLAVNSTFTNVSCNGANDGTISLDITGNVSDLQIDWNVDAFDGTATLANLAPGIYIATVTNAECCEVIERFTISEPDLLSIDCTNIQEATDPISKDGSVTIIASGGGFPNRLDLTDPQGNVNTILFDESRTLQVDSLMAGNYTAVVTDNNGCVDSCDFEIGKLFDCIVIRDEDLQGGVTYNWAPPNCYLLDGLVYLEAGGVLNIQAGTLVKAKSDPIVGGPTSALIIAKGASISATGTAANPIIFTAEADDETAPTDLTASDRGLWGGLVLLGDAPIPNVTNESQETRWEVLDFLGGPVEYGGDGTLANTHLLQYLSIRHAGANVSEDHDFPALTFAGVRETADLSHLEVFASDDRGIAFYGGLAELAYASATFCQGPAFQWQDGYTGKGQFWFALADPGSNSLLADHKGYINSTTQDTTISAPSIFNATYIGGGGTGTPSGVAMRFSQASGGTYGNSIFTHFNGKAVEVEDLPGNTPDGQTLLDAEEQFFFKNNLWWDFDPVDSISVAGGFLQPSAGAPDPDAAFLVDHLIKYRNKAVNPRLLAISNTPNGQLDPRPEECAAFYDNSKYPGDVFFEKVNYKGAFESRDSFFWANGWTALEEQGYFPASFAQIDSTTCRMSLKPGEKFISESPESMPAGEVRKKYDEYETFADLEDDCKCGIDSLPRLTLWEAKLPTDVTNTRGGGEDSSIIDTSGLRVIFDLDDPVIEKPNNMIHCGALPQDDDKDTVNIAIIDSGIEITHSSLSAYRWINLEEQNGTPDIDDDNNCYNDDIDAVDFLGDSTNVVDKDGHGTHLSGIVTLEYPPNLQPQLMNLKVYEKDTLEKSKGTVFDLICAIQYAIDKRADVINLSIGYWAQDASQPLYNALKKAEENGIPVVVSMGNDSINIDESIRKVINPTQEIVYEYRWPVQYKVLGNRDTLFSNMDNLISVASLDDDEKDFATYSNFGTSTLDVATVGAFYSTFPIDTFEAFEGTSMSAAAISKLVSIAKALDETLTIEDIKLCIEGSITKDESNLRGSNLPIKRLDVEAYYNCLGISKEQRGIIPTAEPPDDSVRPIHKKEVDDVLIVRLGDGKKFYEDVVMKVNRITGSINQTVYTLRCSGGIIIWNCHLDDGSILPNGQYFLEFTVNGKVLPNVVGNIVKK